MKLVWSLVLVLQPSSLPLSGSASSRAVVLLSSDQGQDFANFLRLDPHTAAVHAGQQANQHSHPELFFPRFYTLAAQHVFD
eukprot:1047224-Pelagomonas_calceolata.AAC.1